MEIFPIAKTSRKLLIGIVLLLSMLLSINILLIKVNNEKVETNMKLHEQAEKVKLNTLDIIRNLHQLDMGLRGFALTKSGKQQAVVTDTYSRKNEIFDTLQLILKKQEFPMPRFQRMRDSIDLYFDFAMHLNQLIEKKEHTQFLTLLGEDRGYNAYLAYKSFSNEIDVFEGTRFVKYEASYKTALNSSLIFQFILLLISFPALAYTAIFASRSLSISEKLRNAQQENAEILEKQKQKLEQEVRFRTNEIRLQNEEISQQNIEIIFRNEQLLLQRLEIEKQHQSLSQQNAQIKGAHHIIELQNNIIRKKNEELTQEVQLQMQDLKQTNAELLEQNSRLEQFAFIISHNLRAPLTRIVGLASLFQMITAEDERTDIVKKIVNSTMELDEVIKDLSQIIQIQNLNTSVYRLLSLPELIEKIKLILETEIKCTTTQLLTKWEVEKIYSLPQYIESILYNLLSNAIKYRNPLHFPQITIRSYYSDQWIHIEFSDNGLGIDLEKYGEKLFNLYRRFHFHVEGKGLGLYLIKTQLQSLGGRIEVKSEINKGTTFIIILPRTEPNETLLHVPSAEYKKANDL